MFYRSLKEKNYSRKRIFSNCSIEGNNIIQKIASITCTNPNHDGDFCSFECETSFSVIVFMRHAALPVSPAFFFPKLTRRFQFIARRCRRAGFSFEIRAWLQVHRLNRFTMPQARFQPVPKEGTSHRPEYRAHDRRGSSIDRDLPPTCLFYPMRMPLRIYPCLSCNVLLLYFCKGLLFKYLGNANYFFSFL